MIASLGHLERISLAGIGKDWSRSEADIWCCLKLDLTRSREGGGELHVGPGWVDYVLTW